MELNGTDIINVYSEGYSATHVNIHDLESREDEKNTTQALVRGVAVAMQLAWEFLGGRGAVRVNGGGFAGTILTFVPNDMLEEFVSRMDAALGAGSCHILQVRAAGGTCENLT